MISRCVVNASPLIYLTHVGLLEVLDEPGVPVVVPDRVIAEIDTIVPSIKLWAGVGLTAGDTQPLKVFIRRDRVKGPVTLKLSDLPAGIRAGELTVPADQSEGSLPVTADKGVTDGESFARAVVTTEKVRKEVTVSIRVFPTAR